jgi:hypothetical protein
LVRGIIKLEVVCRAEVGAGKDLVAKQQEQEQVGYMEVKGMQ